MTDQQIVGTWLLIPANRDKLPVVAYSQPVYDFIVSTMTCHSFGADDLPVYKVGENWERVICK